MKRFCLQLVLLLILTTVWSGIHFGDQINSLFMAPAEQPSRQMEMSSPGTASGMSHPGTNAARDHTSTVEYQAQTKSSTMKSSWITVTEPQPKAFRVHDLITIIVHEVSKHTTKADTKADRDLKAEASIADWVSLTGGNLRPDGQANGDPKVSLGFNREFEGKSDIKREDTLTTRIQAEIIDIFPNGNLLLEATHKIVTDEETTTITLTGICRSQDLGVDNTILSNKLANLNVSKQHSGIAYDTNKRGWLVRILEAVSPF